MSSRVSKQDVTVNEVFAEARNEFFQALGPQERRMFQACTSEQLIADIKQSEALRPHGSKVRTLMDRISRLESGLSPYFSVVNLFVQSHPETASLVWGGIRLILQLAKNFTSFYDKLMRTFARLAQELPAYDDLATKFDEPPLSLKKPLCLVYTGLLEFLQSVINVFIKKDGRLKHKLRVIADISWKPYDIRFQELLEDLEFYSTLVKTELQLLTYQDVKDSHAILKSNVKALGLEEADEMETKERGFRVLLESLRDSVARLEHSIAQRQWDDKCADHHRVAMIRELKDWLGAPQFALDYEGALDRREQGTAEWLFSERAFTEWKDGRSTCDDLDSDIQDRMLWVNGNPGAGKTILAAATIEEITTSAEPESTCYFFFRDGLPDSDTSTQAYKAILSQILHARQRDRDLIDIYTLAMQKGSGQSRATKHELLDILEICGQHDFMQHVILDGIDECKDSMGLILDLSSVFDNSKVKVIMFSRPHIRFPPEFICKGRIAIAKSNTDDIEAYLTRRLKELLGQGLFPSEAKLEMLLNPLITGADGMFLWAHLMMNYLASTALTRKQRLQEVRNITLPEGLDEMYDRIIEHISQRSRSEQSLASWIFMWLLFSRRQLKIAELETTLKVRGNSSDVDDFAEVDYADLGATIISTCGSLVERVSARNDDSSNLVDCYRFIHLSASEHFRSRLHRRRWRFLLSASDSHITLAKCCLRYIAHIGPEVKLRRSQMDTLGKEPGALRAAYYTKEYAFLPYAMRYWASHLKHHHDNILDVAKAMMYAESRDTLSSLWSILQAPHFNESDESRVQSIQVLTDLFSSIFEIVSNKEMFTTYIEMSYLLDTAGCFDYHSLDRWLTWATPRGQISAEGDEHIRQVIDDAKEMTRYLPFLHHEWGDTLSETPELIRDEVTAFTSCRLLHPVDSTTVYSFMADRADESSASKYLCRVSETSKDQSHLGIVSIWPSKEYENLGRSRMQAHIPPMDDVVSSISGWSVQYEIWDTTKSPKCIFNVRIRLSSEDIWRQYQHSLTLRMYPSMDPNEGWHFGLQFPICISPCLQRFTVLRTVYSIRVNQARTEADIFSTSLSFEPGSNMATQWSVEDTLSHKTVNEFAVWRGDCHQFLYSLVFAPDGHRLLLMGTDPTGVWISLAVFRLENSGYTSAFLAGSMDIEKTAHGFNWSPKNAIQAFHPDYPLVAYTIADMDYHNVYLWMYDIKYHKDPRLRSSSWHCHRTPGKYEKLTFSEDGRFLVLNHTFVREPAVVAIPKKIMKACKMSKNDGPAFESAVLKEKGPIIGSAVYDVGPKKQVKGISAHSVDGKIELRLWDENNQFSTASNVEITRLPDSWTSLRSTSASFCLPSSEDERLKIALVKCRPDAWNYMSVEENQKKDVHLPAVISRDISRLRLGNEAVVDVQSFLESANSTTNSEEQNNDDGNGVGSSGAQNPNNSQKERHTVVFFKGGVATPIG